MAILEEHVGDGPASEGFGIWQQFTVRDGLPDMKIESLFEDSDGAMWIGTHDRGVVRYDGYEFETFSRGEGIGGDGVFSILQDPDGDMWFGTNTGITRYDGERFEQIEFGEACSFLWGSCVDDQGNLWFGLECRPGRPAAVCRWDGREAKLIEVGNRTSKRGFSIHAVIEDGEGGIFCGGHGLYRLSEGQSRELGTDSEILDVIELYLNDGALLILQKTGLYRTVRESIELECVVKTGRSCGGAEGLDGTIWLAETHGRITHCGLDGASVTRRVDASLWQGACVDRLGRLWLGTYGMGLLRCETDRVALFRTDHGLPTDRVRCVERNSQGMLWAGTTGGLARQKKEGSFETRDGTSQLLPFEVTSLASGDGNLWVGTRTGRVYMGCGGSVARCADVDEATSQSISALVVGRDGKAWFSSSHLDVLGYFLDAQSFVIAQDVRHPAHIADMAIDSQGLVWVASSNIAQWDGLCCIDTHDFTLNRQVALGVPVFSLCRADDGRFWIGTTDGLVRYDPESDQIHRETDLPCAVKSLAAGGEGSVWIGTEGGGVYHYDGEVLQTIEFSDSAANVVHDVFRDDCGDIWFATDGGLIRYRPANSRPEILITRVLAEEEILDLENVQISEEASHFVVQFRGRSDVDGVSQLVYRCRLDGADGVDGEWRQTNACQMEYSRLSPGDYTFSVQAIDRDLSYSRIATMKVKVIPDPRMVAFNEALRAGPGQTRFVGESRVLREVEAIIKRVAQADATVLILGETGTGKGIAARMVHEMSPRREGMFIQVNCGALQEGLVDSELFGHERGAFTGAVTKRLGKFELADGGSIFLDEIGDLPPASQTKLLHVLQEFVVERVGGTKRIRVDVRVIAATNRDLNEAIARGTFRSDLYYRLNTFPINMPPLRDRRGDLPQLARHFVQLFAEHLNRKPPQITDEAMAHLLSYDWPGNVRELEHIMERAVILVDGSRILPEHTSLSASGAGGGNVHEDAILPIDEYERRYFARVLKHTAGVIQGKHGAAVLLGMHPNTLRSRLAKLGVKVGGPGKLR